MTPAQSNQAQHCSEFPAQTGAEIGTRAGLPEPTSTSSLPQADAYNSAQRASWAPPCSSPFHTAHLEFLHNQQQNKKTPNCALWCDWGPARLTLQGSKQPLPSSSENSEFC